MATEFEGFAIVELMGHRKLAGYVREVTIAGAAMLRLDIPSDPPVTQYYGASSLYCLTPTTEDLATRVAKASRPTPVHQYELPAPKPANVCPDCGVKDGEEHDPLCVEQEARDDSERDYDPDEDRSPDSGDVPDSGAF